MNFRFASIRLHTTVAVAALLAAGVAIRADAPVAMAADAPAAMAAQAPESQRDATGNASAARARAILDHVDDLFRGRSSHGRASMSVTTANWQRTLVLEFWNQGKDKSLIRILAPQKEKGTATLKSGTDIWNWLPKVARVIKLPSSMMSASWMGSHFTNDDLVKDSRMAEDYDVEISFEGQRDGRDEIDIVCHPKPDAAVVWGRVEVVVLADGLMPLVVRYYDEVGALARTLTYENVRMMAGRLLPTTLRIVPADKPGESTVVVYEEIAFDVDLPPDTFSLRTLQK